jgi:hypothetical protein
MLMTEIDAAQADMWKLHTRLGGTYGSTAEQLADARRFGTMASDIEALRTALDVVQRRRHHSDRDAERRVPLGSAGKGKPKPAAAPKQTAPGVVPPPARALPPEAQPGPGFAYPAHEEVDPALDPDFPRPTEPDPFADPFDAPTPATEG